MDQILHQTLVSAASQLEQQLDSQINQLDNLDTDDLQALRNQRINELKELNKKKQEWLNNGHGQVIVPLRSIGSVCLQLRRGFYTRNTYTANLILF